MGGGEFDLWMCCKARCAWRAAGDANTVKPDQSITASPARTAKPPIERAPTSKDSRPRRPPSRSADGKLVYLMQALCYRGATAQLIGQELARAFNDIARPQRPERALILRSPASRRLFLVVASDSSSCGISGSFCARKLPAAIPRVSGDARRRSL